VIYRFGYFELDEEAGLLRKAGEPVAIQPKPFELLRVLLRERERVVPSDELFALLWPDTVVTPGSLNRAVSHARRAVDDTHKGRLIESVARRGYRFCGKVVALERGAPEAAPARAAARGAAPFVGRAQALGALREAFAQAEAGRGGLALVTGPPGIGKTRLVEVFAEEVASRGPLALVGRAREGEGVPAFWLWAQLLRQLLDEPTLGADARELAAGSAELAGLIPELGAPAGARGSASPEQSRFLFFDAVARTLSRASRRRPLLLVLEDLQWAGSASLRLLEHLAFECAQDPLLIVATVRDEPRERGHPLHRTLPLLRQRERCAQVSLRAFSRAEVGELLQAAVGRRPPAEVTSELFARTEGVPLYLREALRLLAERGELAQLERVARRGIQLPGHAIDFIRRALEQLSAPCAELMAAASALGREFALPLAASVASLPRERALDLLDEAERAGVVEAVAGVAATWRFTHALHQEAAYESLPAGTRARLHQRIAERLEQLHADDPQRVIAELAHHHHRALAVGDAERAHERALQAARRASELLAYEQCALHYEQAASALLHCEPVDPARRLETLLALAGAHRLCGERSKSREVLQEAMQIARAQESAADFARAAIGFCDPADWAVYDPPARAAIEEAAALLGDERGVLAARISTRLAWLSSRRPPKQVEPVARRALALAREHGDPQAELEAVYTLQLVLAGPDPGRLDARAELADRLAALGARTSPRDLAMLGLIDAASDELERGDLAAARARRAAAGAQAGEKPHTALAWYLAIWDTGMQLLEGRLEEAARTMHDALTAGQRIEHPYAQGVYASHRGELHALRGDAEGVCAWFEPMTRAAGGPSHWNRATLARAELAAGREPAARALFEQLAAERFGELPRGIRYLRTLCELAHLCADLEDAPRAALLRELLAPYERRHAVMAAPVLYGGPVSFALARLCEALGRSDEAAALFEAARADCDELGARPFRARVLLEHGRLCARRGERRAARELLGEAADLAGKLGMEGAAQAAAAARERAER
jgi:DNA-binding winged helix-turn-helix (wHTH) protein